MTIGFAKNHMIDKNFEFEKSLFPNGNYQINAAIVEHDNRLLCVYRTDSLDEFDAKSYLTALNEDFSPKSHLKLIPENDNTAFEDVRLFSFQGELLAFYTYLPGNKQDSWVFHYGVAMGIIDVDSGRIMHQQSLRKYSQTVHSKNWIPYEYNDELYLITDFDPRLEILKGVKKNGIFEFTQYYSENANLPHWRLGNIRGGTPFISRPGAFNDWLYGFSHSHVVLPNGFIWTRFYFSIAMKFNPTTKEIQINTLPLDYSNDINCKEYALLWKKATRGNLTKVVFPMGVISSDEGLLISYGKDDCISRLQFYSWSSIEGLFQ